MLPSSMHSVQQLVRQSLAEQEPKKTGFDGSWAAWKDRLGIAAVLIAVALLFLFMFTDASLNFQCSVTDFIMMKCNRFKRDFKPWDQLEKKQPKSSLAPAIEGYGGSGVPRGGKTVGFTGVGWRFWLQRPTSVRLHTQTPAGKRLRKQKSIFTLISKR